MKSKIESLREVLKAHSLGGYIVPTKDEFQSEYPSAFARRLEYLTEFTCSNGVLVIFENRALFFTDSRYLNAAKESIKDAEVFDIRGVTNFDWAFDKKVGYDPKILTKYYLKIFEKLNLVPVNGNLVDKIWQNQPSIPASLAYHYDIKYSGQEADKKIEILREIIKKKKYESLLITSPESVCWLLNIRASDSETSPIMLSYCYVDADKLVLFTSDREFATGALPKEVVLKDFSELEGFLQNMNTKICVPNNCAIAIAHLIPSDKLIEDSDPILLLRAIKNETEIEGAKQAHIKDAVALIEFFAWFEENGIGLDEYELGLKLTEFRDCQESYVMDSFEPICGFRANGAKIHYKADEKTAEKISGNGLLLIDSGGHYLGGTTDVTRTIAIGEPTHKQKEYYTKVLKGHIALAKVRFPKGLMGCHLDVLARQNLWDICEDYGHGTGHGVGNMLSVHEGPMSISLNDKSTILQEGMILSNEPGYYKDGEFGIRIENLQYIKKCEENVNFLQFEQLTLVPYCSDLILFDRLNADETSYLRQYNKRIEEVVMPLLSDRGREFLRK